MSQKSIPGDRKSLRIVVSTNKPDEPNILKLNLQDPVKLLREPDNPADYHSVKVEDERGNFLGYIMREWAKFVSPFMDLTKYPIQGRVIGLATDSSGRSMRLKICFNIPAYWCRIETYPEHRYMQDISYCYWKDPAWENVKIFVNCSERLFRKIKRKLLENNFKHLEYWGLPLRQPLDKPPYQWALHFRKSSGITEEAIKKFFKEEFNNVSASDRIKTIEKELQNHKQEQSTLQKSLRKAEDLVQLSDQLAHADQQKINELKHKSKQLKMKLKEKDRQVKYLMDEQYHLEKAMTQIQDYESQKTTDVTPRNELYAFVSQTISKKVTKEEFLPAIENLCKAISGRVSTTELLQVIEHLFPDRIIVLKRALKSSQKIKTSKHNQKILDLLWKLVTELWEVFSDKKKRNDPLSIFSQKDYAQDEGQWTDNPICIENRTFTHNGESVLMMEHLKITPEQYRIHFKWNKAEKKFVLGHCGYHLPHK